MGWFLPTRVLLTSVRILVHLYVIIKNIVNELPLTRSKYRLLKWRCPLTLRNIF